MMFLTNPTSFLVVSAVGLLAACNDKPQFDCDVKSEDCPGLNVQIDSPNVIQKAKSEAIAFTVTYRPKGQHENLANLKAALVSIENADDCRSALVAKTAPQAPLHGISCTGTDTLVCMGTSSQSELSVLSLGKVALCVYGHDVGGISTFIVNKILVPSQGSLSPIQPSDFSPLKKTTPISIGIFNNMNMITLLFQGDNPLGYSRQQINVYKYISKTNYMLITSITDAGGASPLYRGTLAATNTNGLFLLWTNTGDVPMAMPKPPYIPSACPLMTLTKCNLNSTPNNWINDNVTALADDPNRQAFAIATDQVLRGYTYPPVNGQPLNPKWEVQRAAGTVRLALGDLDGSASSLAEGMADTVAVWPAAGWPNNGLVKVIVGTTEQMSYSSGLTAGFVAALNTIVPLPSTIDAFTIGDLDGDGRSDVVVGGGNGLRILFNQGAGAFRLGGASPLDVAEKSLLIPITDKLIDVAIGDVDGLPGNEIVTLTSKGMDSATITTYSLM